MTTPPPYPYLTDEHALADGERTADALPIEGEIPEGLSGTFARNTGNPAFAPSPRYHWFDGDGMVHAISLADGRASYRSRWIRTEGFLREQAAGRPLWAGLNEPPLEGGLRGAKDTANTDLVWWDGQMIATWWLSGTPMALSRDLDTLGPAAAGATPLPRMSAHPKVDPRTGELVFFSYDAFKKPYYRVGVASPDGRVRVEPIDLPHAHVPHDIAITENYTILLDLPLGWDPAALAAGKRRIGFFRDRPARFGIMPRHGTNADIRWFEDDACYIYHLIGSYEEGRTVVLLGCRISDPIPEGENVGGFPHLDSIRLEPYLHRWTFDLDTGAVQRERLDDTATEFPRADDRTWGRRLRHAYHPRVARRSALAFDGVQKVDLDRGTSMFRPWPAGWYSGEVVFAPRPGGTADDDGWVVTALTSARERASALVVLDAPTMEEVARIPLPAPIPLGFHAAWSPL